MSRQKLFEAAAAVLRQNDRGRFTVPSPRLYPHQWAWDSAFAALGWVYLDKDRALRELETLMAGIWDNGMLPHIQFHTLSPDYFPGPEVWEGPRASSTITQPPVWATIALRMLKLGADRARIAALLPAFEASHRFFAAERDPLGWDCVAVAHPWESGLDNSPVWDRPLAAIDPAKAPDFQRVDTQRVAEAAQRPTDDDYRRYLYLVKTLAAHEFKPTEWAVYDPLMTTLLIQGERALAQLGAELGFATAAPQRAERLQAGLLQHLWSQERKRFAYYDVFGERYEWAVVIGAYLPAILNLSDAYQGPVVAALLERFNTPYPFPSTSPHDPCYDPQRYWRGPVWVNTNWLLAPVLGPDVIEISLRMVEQGGFFEYFDPKTAVGLGGADFTWTAALVMDWLVQTGQVEV